MSRRTQTWRVPELARLDFVPPWAKNSEMHSKGKYIFAVEVTVATGTQRAITRPYSSLQLVNWVGLSQNPIHTGTTKKITIIYSVDNGVDKPAKHVYHHMYREKQGEIKESTQQRGAWTSNKNKRRKEIKRREHKRGKIETNVAVQLIWTQQKH